MKLTKLTKKAWEIRKEAAKKWNCGIMEISWKGCLEMANENSINDLENVRIWKEKRAYFTEGYANKANAYATSSKNDCRAKYVWTLGNLFVCANKCYNGSVESELNLTRHNF